MAIQILAQIDNRLAELAGKQAPFITSLALNRTAIGARDLVRENLPKRFRLRNNWTRGGIQTRTSTKANLMAQVLAPGYMALQETGGMRKPLRSKALVAPTQESPSVLPKNKRPRALIQSGKAFVLPLKDGNAGVFERFGKKRGQIRLLFTLADQQQYQERFEFEDDVREHVRTKFGSNFAAAFAQAMK